MELFKILGKIALDNTEANDAMDETTSKSKTLASKMESLGKNVSAFGDKIASAGATLTKTVTVPMVAAGTALVGVANSAANAADNVDKMSQKIGISRTAYQELDFICSQSGASVDSLQMGLKTMTNQMQSAQSGTKSAVTMFEKLGLSIYDSAGNLKDQETMMWETMSALQGMENQTEKAALATDLFGRSGSELMPLLNGAAGSIEEMKQQAHDLGLVMGDEAIDAGVEYTDKMDQLKRSYKAVAVEAGTKLLPLLTQLMDFIMVKGLPIFDKLVTKAEMLFDWFSNLGSGSQTFIGALVGVAAAAGPTLMIIGKLVAVIGTIITAISGSEIVGPILAIIAVIGAITAAITALVGIITYFWETNEDFRNRITETWNSIKDKFTEVFEILKENYEAYVLPTIRDFIAMAQELWNENQDKLNLIAELFAVIFEFIAGVIIWFCDFWKENLLPIFVFLYTTVSENMDKIKAVFQAAIDVLAGIIKFFIALFKGDWKGMWDAVLEILKSCVELAKNWFVLMKEYAVAILNALWSKIVEIWGNIKLAISQKLDNIVSDVQAKFQAIKDSITEKINDAKNAVYEAIEKIKSFFDFEWRLPELKLPHITIQGSFSLDPPSVPTFGIDWYAKGGILNSPTLFGFNGNRAMIGGEAGAEAVAPIDVLQGYVAKAVAEQNAGLVDVLQKILVAIYSMDDSLSEKYIEALKNMRFDINNREFARLVKAVN